MDHYTIIITKEQKALIAKALEVFSQMHLGQTSIEREVAKKLEKRVRVSQDSRYGVTTINNLTS